MLFIYRAGVVITSAPSESTHLKLSEVISAPNQAAAEKIVAAHLLEMIQWYIGDMLDVYVAIKDIDPNNPAARFKVDVQNETYETLLPGTNLDYVVEQTGYDADSGVYNTAGQSYDNYEELASFFKAVYTLKADL